ncbi:complement C1r subcomponent-like [Engraulis encrasicolus]|uniref:complement C1r subcomponent-like n=1 Tax=Engraulis encrasicolus TaxID=184585 RepID=UPI002FD332A8
MKWKLSVLCLLCASVCVKVCVGEEEEEEDRTPVEMHGMVTSPLYPKPYPGNVYVEWELAVPKGYRIQLSFTHLDIEPSDDCYYDSLMVIYDQKVLWKFCGQANSADGNHPGNEAILAPGNRLRLIFQTDEGNPGLHKPLGFSLFYQAVDVDECKEGEEVGKTPPCAQLCLNTLGSYYCSCHHGYDLRADQRTCTPSCHGGEFRELQGTLSSPGYPEPSPHGLQCIYNITVDPGYLITLNFSRDFHIEHIQDHQPSCLYHWLQVTIPGREPLKLCGGESPGLLHTGSHWAELEYHTDWAGLSRGWRLHYTTQRVRCDIPNGIVNGHVTPSLPEYLYKDYIYVRCETGYKLMKEGKEIPKFGSMCQSNGQWHNSLPECHIIDCGDPMHLMNGNITFISEVKENQYRSVIEYRCNEPYYSFDKNYKEVQLTCEADRKWKQASNDVIPVCVPVCGRPKHLLRSSQRIFHGELAKRGEFPWQVLLNAGGRGGAFVIAPQWILTAAHNLMNVEKQEIKLRVGSIVVDELLKTRPLEVDSVHIHPNYIGTSGGRKDFDNDIALIKLVNPITFGEDIMPLCLPRPDSQYPTGKLGSVSGFGVDEKGSVLNELRYVRLPLVDQAKCRASIDAQKSVASDISDFTDNMFCAGFPEGSKDTCQGDSGGAYVLQEGDSYWAAGIVSWGISCGKADVYGVYTRVAQYLDWLTKTMEQNV